MEEKILLTTVVPFQIYSDYADGATHARLQLTRSNIVRIILLSEDVKKLGVYEITDYDRPYELLDTDYEIEKSPLNLYSEDGEPLVEATEFRDELNLIHIQEHECYWTCLDKYSDPAVHCETNSITIDTLKQVMEIADAKFEDLAQYVGRSTLTPIADQFLKERLNENA